jgi:hypothetical protein
MAVVGPIDYHGGGLLRQHGAAKMGAARRRLMLVRLIRMAEWINFKAQRMNPERLNAERLNEGR